MIEKNALKTVLEELRDELTQKVHQADRNAKDCTASQFYCSDQKGYSRGIFTATYNIIDTLVKKFQL